MKLELCCTTSHLPFDRVGHLGWFQSLRADSKMLAQLFINGLVLLEKSAGNYIKLYGFYNVRPPFSIAKLMTITPISVWFIWPLSILSQASKLSYHSEATDCTIKSMSFLKFFPSTVNWFSQLVGALEHVLFSHKLGIIIPIDFHIFQRGLVNHQPAKMSRHMMGQRQTVRHGRWVQRQKNGDDSRRSDRPSTHGYQNVQVR